MYNPFSLEGKTVLITGASSGIGRATAIECSKLGARCILTARNEDRLNETLSHLEGDGHSYIVADLTNAEEIERLATEVPEIDGLVNNAGIAHTKLIAFLKQTDLDIVFSANTFGPVMLTKWLLKKKKIKNEGSIVFTSSIAALSANLGNSVYGMSKSAIMTFAEYCAAEVAGKNIRVNSVHPGMVNTNMTQSTLFSPEELEVDRNKYPIKRYGEPEEIAWGIIYLLSDATKWVTGTQLVIDGGVHLRR